MSNNLDVIFKSYDIRGVFGDTLSLQDAYKIGYSFAEFVDSETILIGHDGRLSNMEMLNAVASGISISGKSVLYVGLVPTDVVYSLSGLLELPGIVITASHNPKEYNGLKLCNSGAVPIGEHSGLLEIKNNIKNIDHGVISNLNLNTSNELDLYFEHIKKLVKPEKVNSQIKFGVDGGNGAIGAIFEDLSTIYNFECEKLYMEVDGNFPNHPADPSNKDNLKEVIKLVQEKKLDFGVAFDGDADRAVFIDDTGKVVSGSMMTTLIADYLSENNDNLKVVHNVNVSPHALSILDSKNISLFRCKVGHSNIKAMMKELEADFGGEHSAHFYYKDNYFADSAILTLLMFMTIISERGEKVSSMFDQYNFPPSSGEINFEVEDVERSLEKIKTVFTGDFDELDGLSYFDENFWFNVRGSNTEPKLRVNIEAPSQKILDEVLEKISTTI
ncbi:MAG: phosphomannomutase/phosphoglucomutase [Proteobacteria bacterium]|jgi:phosphomannomutase|nr:phosphomannomutase/phosphoglucomutase [Pseudomonadota bacterium]NCX34778.1 phosphomannomutase/phosphoglucomutase [Pseudomonadota bacterium]